MSIGNPNSYYRNNKNIFACGPYKGDDKFPYIKSPVVKINNAFVIDPSYKVNNTKINLDDPTFTNAFIDAGSSNWTTQDLVDALNNVTSSTTFPSGIDYSGTVWGLGVNSSGVEYVYVISGNVPTSLDLVSIPVSIPVSTV